MEVVATIIRSKYINGYSSSRIMEPPFSKNLSLQRSANQQISLIMGQDCPVFPGQGNGMNTSSPGPKELPAVQWVSLAKVTCSTGEFTQWVILLTMIQSFF